MERGWGIEELERNGIKVLIIYYKDSDDNVEPRGQILCMTKEDRNQWMKALEFMRKPENL